MDRTTTSYLLWNMLFLGGGALWAALGFPPLLRKQKLPPRPDPWSRDDIVVYTTTITVLCTASTLGVLIWRPGSNGAWVVLTVLAVTQFGADTHLKRTLGRVAGTLAGVVIATIVASVTNSEAALLAIGLVLQQVAHRDHQSAMSSARQAGQARSEQARHSPQPTGPGSAGGRVRVVTCGFTK